MPDWFALTASCVALTLSIFSLWLNCRTLRFWREQARRLERQIMERHRDAS